MYYKLEQYYRQDDAALDITSVLPLLHERIECKGNFILIGVTDEHTHFQGAGISRCSRKDTWSTTRGIAIARGRAEKALYLKLTNQPITHHYMG